MKGTPALDPQGERTIDLFHDLHEANLRRAQPLAALIRHGTPADYI